MRSASYAFDAKRAGPIHKPGHRLDLGHLRLDRVLRDDRGESC